MLFLVEGAPVPEDIAAYQRLVLLFDGNDEDALAAARAQWTRVKAGGFDATYWQQDPRGPLGEKGLKSLLFMRPMATLMIARSGK